MPIRIRFERAEIPLYLGFARAEIPLHLNRKSDHVPPHICFQNAIPPGTSENQRTLLHRYSQLAEGLNWYLSAEAFVNFVQEPVIEGRLLSEYIFSVVYKRV